MRAELCQELSGLRALLEPQPTGLSAETERQILSDLIDGLNTGLTELVAGAAVFRDPQGLQVSRTSSIDSATAATTLSYEIRDRAVLAVYGWPEWNPLLLGVRDGQKPPAPRAFRRART